MQLFMPFLWNGYFVPILTLGTDIWNYAYTPLFVLWHVQRQLYFCTQMYVNQGSMCVEYQQLRWGGFKYSKKVSVWRWINMTEWDDMDILEEWMMAEFQVMFFMSVW
jgi:hypothetical protein